MEVWGLLSFMIGSLQFFTLKLVHIEPPAIYQSQHWFIWRLSAHRFLLTGFCSPKLWFSVPACLSLQFWGQCLFLWPLCSYRYKRNWFFSLLSFLQVVRLEWWFPSSLHARPGIGSCLSEVLGVCFIHKCRYPMDNQNPCWQKLESYRYQFGRWVEGNIKWMNFRKERA